jgi:D-xylose reductase
MEYAPVPMRETWEAMQEQHARGKARNIGVCNLTTSGMRDLLSYATVPPAVLQVQPLTTAPLRAIIHAVYLVTM